MAENDMPGRAGRKVSWQERKEKGSLTVWSKEEELREGWRKYQNDNVGQREVIENIWVRSYKNSLKESIKKKKKSGQETEKSADIWLQGRLDCYISPLSSFTSGGHLRWGHGWNSTLLSPKGMLGFATVIEAQSKACSGLWTYIKAEPAKDWKERGPQWC